MLLTGRNLSKSYGPRVLFSGITLGLAEGERVGLVGANGSGKSTLLKIFAGEEFADEGQLVARKQLRVGYVAQEDSFPDGVSCAQLVASRMDEHLDEHEREVGARLVLERAGFMDVSALASTLSGGWRKRLAIVCALAREPELLLLDEPTNHLDIEGILWLEKIISGGAFATLTVSHDRRFLEATANRIIELGRAYPEGFLSHIGSYSEFLAKREEFLLAQAGQERALASGVRREIEWLKRGAKARTTKAKGRIERAGEMMSDLAELRQRNQQTATTKIDFIGSGRQTRKLIEFKNVGKSMGQRKLFSDVNFVLSPGGRLGLLGPNGSGKSTLIRLISGELSADSGEIVQANQVRVVVFDQHREVLDEKQTLRRALSPGGDVLSFRGDSMHVSSWAGRFLFRIEQLDMPVGELSGGEQARVLIARLMLQPADVLVLDEPTNDLDIATLDVLEMSLEDFPGAVVMVTHDRYLLDRVSSEILALDGKGSARMFVDLAQWENAEEPVVIEKKIAAKAPVKAPSDGKKKLSWNEQRELEKMEDAIAKAEAEVEVLQARVGDPTVLADHIKMHDACEKLAAGQREVERLYARWTELESRKG